LRVSYQLHGHLALAQYLLLQVFRRVFSHQFAAINNQNPVTNLLGFREDMRREHDGLFFTDLPDQFTHLDNLHRVQADGWLIQNQYFWLVDERLG